MCFLLHKGSEIKKTYNRIILESSLNEVNRRIEELKKVANKIGQQMQVLDKTGFRKEVHLERQHLRGENVHYTVSLHLVPNIPDPESVRYPTEGDYQKFPGNKKKAAREYARQLTEKHGAPLVDEAGMISSKKK